MTIACRYSQASWSLASKYMLPQNGAADMAHVLDSGNKRRLEESDGQGTGKRRLECGRHKRFTPSVEARVSQFIYEGVAKPSVHPRADSTFLRDSNRSPDDPV
jgi:hypothetical protein